MRMKEGGRMTHHPSGFSSWPCNVVGGAAVAPGGRARRISWYKQVVSRPPLVSLRMNRALPLIGLLLAWGMSARVMGADAAPAAPAAASLPAPAGRHVDFAKEIKPLFEASCIQCHGKGKDKGGFSLETRQAF